MHAMVIFGYLLLAVLMTYPLAENLFSHVPGCCDIYQNLWNIWWVKKSLFELHTSPYYTDYLYQPYGVSLALHTLSFFNSVLGAVLQGFVGYAGGRPSSHFAARK